MLILGLSAFLAKDIFNGRSIGKRVLKLQVLDQRTSLPLTPLKSVLRNITTIVLLPLEVIAIIVNPERRIGDKFVGSCVQRYALNSAEYSLPALLIGSISSIFLSSIIFLMPFSLLTGEVHESKMLNLSKSDSLSNLINKEIRPYIVKDVTVTAYDGKEDSELAYVKIVCNLRENYFDENFPVVVIVDSIIQNSVKQVYLPLTYKGIINYHYEKGIVSNTVIVDLKSK